MDGAFLYSYVYIIYPYELEVSQIDPVLAQGWFILRGSHFVCRPKDSGLYSGLKNKPSILSSLLPESDRSDPSPDITTNRIDWHGWHTDSPQYHSTRLLPHPMLLPAGPPRA